MPQNVYLPEGMLINTDKNRAAVSSIAALERAMLEERILEGRAIVCDASHNLIVDLGGISGIIPRGEAALGISEGITHEIAIISRVGRTVCFKVSSIISDGKKPRVILSRRAAQTEALDYFMSNLQNGDVIKARVTHLEPFGAFVDIGCGIISLIGIENISVSRISHPSRRFHTGMDIFTVVLSKDPVMRRIILSHKELLGTWEENATPFSAGETVRGIIRGIEDYGVFIELTPNLSGLSEKRDGIFEGQPASVYIKSIIPERMKIKLIIIDTFPQNPMPERHNLKYYITSGRMDKWIYTPPYCKTKLIQTVF